MDNWPEKKKYNYGSILTRSSIDDFVDFDREERGGESHEVRQVTLNSSPDVDPKDMSHFCTHRASNNRNLNFCFSIEYQPHPLPAP